jgi:GNAT superfamily N-acetyltransferase
VTRPARPSDVPALLGLIRELASYEREPESAKAGPGDLDRWLFGPDPVAGAFVAEAATGRSSEDGQNVAGDAGGVVGMAIWFRTFSTWTGKPGLYLEDLFVREGHRGRGLGRDLFLAVAREAIRRGYPRMDWAVLDWNRSAQDFYRRFGAEPMSSWQTWRLTGPALAATADARSGQPPQRPR